MTIDSKPAGRRALDAVWALALLAFLVFEAVKHGLWLPAVIGMLAPDVALFGGMSQGRLNPRAVPLYNVLHMYWGPVTLMAVAATGVIALGWFVLGLAWAAHVAVDRALGYGLRVKDGFQRGG
ncbi:DUF4260 family protein [Solirubrobacter sp. CPCC 204708]|uniref:DUF4260 domain-containing protein n=1 Tax=Solirubrobacter deserti TaxID=2282478 RepID=A0ABT4RHP6_9ACTN|nr:DUF4260 family protein [Solirubrobacter deserti]MBE2316541.1 DUF4260 family protein [Solirubrobacter deserti]MDA0138075.1 DUF4260 domain-containing protein [Solirubrobacter deserti]